MPSCRHRLATALTVAAALCAPFAHAAPNPFAGLSTGVWIPATDTTRVRAGSSWWATAFRYPPRAHLAAFDDGAALELDFEGSGLAIRLAAHATSSYGRPNLGRLRVEVDGEPVGALRPLDEPREVLVADGLAARMHRLRLVHVAAGEDRGVRIEGFLALRARTGSLTFHVGGEDVTHMVDARAVLTRDGVVVRDALVRNWQSGICRLVGLPPGSGYRLEVRAVGWQTEHVYDVRIEAGRDTALPMVYLRRELRTREHGVRFPTVGHPVVRRAGDSLRTRLVIYGNVAESMVLRRTVGPALITRELAIEKDLEAAFYYDHEFVARLPGDVPPGLYDLVATVRASPGHSYEVPSARSVLVVDEYPDDPLFMTFGHLDTWGQYQAEYLRRLADIADIIGPDMVLISNAVSAAYASGALVDLHVPYAITFGNHEVAGHELWYGDPVGVIDFGAALSVLNFGRYWHEDLTRADALLAERHETRIKAINAVEHNAPVEAFLDRHRIAYIHDAHGPGDRVMQIGATPTQRAGKSNSESFRLVRFRDGRVVSATYHGDAEAPIPCARDARSPVRIAYDAANDGTRHSLTAVLTNELLDPLPDCRAVFVMPRGDVEVDGGRLESAVDGDDGVFTVVTARCDLPAEGEVRVTVASR